MVEQLPNKCEALCSYPNTIKEKKREGSRKDRRKEDERTKWLMSNK
jgi:hypothetical protein